MYTLEQSNKFKLNSHQADRGSVFSLALEYSKKHIALCICLITELFLARSKFS